MTNQQTATDGTYLNLALGEGLVWFEPTRSIKGTRRTNSHTMALTKVTFAPCQEPPNNILFIPATCNSLAGYLVIQPYTIHFYPGSVPLLRKKRFATQKENS